MPPTADPLAALGVPIDLSVSPRASRLTLRVDGATGRVRVTVPPGVGREQADAFAARHAGWIRRRLEAIPERVPFAVGTEIPVLGVPHRIRQDATTRAPARLARGEDGPEIMVGRTEFPERRVLGLLKAEAERELAARTREKAARIGRRVASVAVQDTRSQWGRCSASGHIRYSWRLILAPEGILDYLVAHEVAHLEHMDHSRRFWRLCASLSAVPAERARAWLRRHGQALHRYGPPDR